MPVMEAIGLTLAVVAILWTRARGRTPERAGVVDLWVSMWLFVGAAVLQAVPLVAKADPAWVFFGILVSAIGGLFVLRGVLLLESPARHPSPASDLPRRGAPEV